MTQVATREKARVIFDGERQKVLHERLDAVFADLSELTQPELTAALETILTWQTDAELWKLVRHWVEG